MKAMLVLAVMAAGCAAPSGTSSAPEPCDDCVFTPVLDLRDCSAVETGFVARAGVLQERLPDGYSLIQYDPSSALLTSLATRWMTCTDIVIDNRTVLGPTSLVFTWAAVRVPDAIDQPPNSFVFELYVDDARLADALKARGFETHNATITHSGSSWSVTDPEGAVILAHETSGQRLAEATSSEARRMHGAREGVGAFLDIQAKERRSDATLTARIQGRAGTVVGDAAFGAAAGPAFTIQSSPLWKTEPA